MNGVDIKDRAASATGALAPSQGERAAGAIVKHIVMWNVRADTPDQRADGIARIKAGFEALRGRIPGMLAIEIGVDSSGVDYACDVVLYSEFESQAALDDYATHPAHLALRDALEGVRIARHQVDYRAEPTR